MKSKLVLLGVVAGGFSLLAGCGEKSRFEYHPGVNGQVMWRCNRDTGEVFLSYLGQPWRPVTGEVEAQIASGHLDDKVISKWADASVKDLVSELSNSAPNLPVSHGTPSKSTKPR